MENSGELKRIFEALKKELHGAILADEMYTLQNEAKFRAVQQNVGTYEEFKDIVDAAHLQPITKSDKAQKPKTWNVLASNSVWSPPDYALTGVASQQSKHAACEVPPTTPQKFWQTWQKSCFTAPDRFHLLKLVDREHLAIALTSERCWCVFGEVIQALGEFEDLNEDLELVTWVLTIIANMQRFQLHLQLFGMQECQSLTDLFQLLKIRIENRHKSQSSGNLNLTHDAIVDLENKYRKC